MQLPVVIEALPDGRGFAARLTAPLQLSAEASTPEAAQQQLAVLLQERLQAGARLGVLNVPMPSTPGAEPGWLPDDEVTRQWLQEVEQYRAECDAADRARLGTAPREESPP